MGHLFCGFLPTRGDSPLLQSKSKRMPTTIQLDSVTPNNYLEVDWKEVEQSLKDLEDEQEYYYPKIESDYCFDWGEAYG